MTIYPECRRGSATDHGTLVEQPFLAVRFRTSRIATSPQPEYPLPSRGGLGCAWVWQGSASSLESSSHLFFVLLFVLRRTHSSGIKNSIPKCAGAASVRSAEAA